MTKIVFLIYLGEMLACCPFKVMVTWYVLALWLLLQGFRIPRSLHPKYGSCIFRDTLTFQGSHPRTMCEGPFAILPHWLASWKRLHSLRLFFSFQFWWLLSRGHKGQLGILPFIIFSLAKARSLGDPFIPAAQLSPPSTPRAGPPSLCS